MNTNDTQNIDGNTYHVIIDSIGSANPSASKMLSDVLGTPVELIVQALYNTPTVLFTNIDGALAEQCNELLNTLGMVSRIQPSTDPLPEKQDPVDVGVYIHDIEYVPVVAKKLSEFLGCGLQEAFNLLTSDPCVVLGNVSESTAQALCDRLDTEVIISAPKKDLYTVFFGDNNDNKMLLHKLQSHLKYLKLDVDADANNRISNLDYKTAQDLWKKFQSTGLLKMINQSFQRFEINLVKVDESNENFRSVLMEETGMPAEIIDNVIANLPIQLEASANGKTVADKLKLYSAAGLNCTAHVIKPNNYKLIIAEMGDLQESKTVLAQYLSAEELPNKESPWEFPKPLGDLLYRCIADELEEAGCTVDYDYYIK
ncbi:MAG: hypothetical protein GQ574_21670 [Crocinitomix sp.]|nr:hypothetical protein [Crocinitomix sp.]